jgi:hypothetical protein
MLNIFCSIFEKKNFDIVMDFRKIYFQIILKFDTINIFFCHQRHQQTMDLREMVF